MSILKAGGEYWAAATADSSDERLKPEVFFGAHETREEALARARHDYPDARGFWVARGVGIDPIEYLRADDVIETLNECGGEPPTDDEPWELLPGAEAALQEALNAWAHKFVRPECWRELECEYVENEGSEGRVDEA